MRYILGVMIEYTFLTVLLIQYFFKWYGTYERYWYLTLGPKIQKKLQMCIQTNAGIVKSKQYFNLNEF